MTYLLVKFFHVLIAILALGTSGGPGIVLEFYGNNPTHGTFVLRAIERVVSFFVLPGYVLMLVTGYGWSFLLVVDDKMDPGGTRAMGSGMAIHVLFLAGPQAEEIIRRHGTESSSYRRVSLLGRGLGAGLGLIVVGILYLMVFKPWA